MNCHLLLFMQPNAGLGHVYSISSGDAALSYILPLVLRTSTKLVTLPCVLASINKDLPEIPKIVLP